MLLSSAIIFPRLRTSSAQLRAASAIRWQRFHTVPACLIFNSRASSRRTSLQLPVARYLALHRHTESSPGRTISRTSPEAIRTKFRSRLRHTTEVPSHLWLFEHICVRSDQNGPRRPKFRSRLRHTTEVPSHLWRSNTFVFGRSELQSDLDFTPAAISGSQLGALHDPGVPGSNSSSMHPSPPCAHAHYWWKDGVPHEDSILLLSSRRAVGHESFLSFPAPTAISAIVALASSVED